MKRLQRAALLTAMTDELWAHHSWCGETHVQKATYVFKELFEPELDYEFILYKHGPFSFELRDELASLRADGLLSLEPQSYPYGPRLKATDTADNLRELYPRTLEREMPGITFVAARLGGRGVTELERLATAFFVTRNMPGSVEERASRLVTLKPHIAAEAAREAVTEVDEMIRGAQAVTT